MRAPIHSIKHYVSNTNVSISSGALRANIIVDAVAVGATSNTFDITEGSLIKAVFIEQWIKSSATANTSVQFTAILEKVPAGQDSVVVAELATLQAYDNKKNVLWTGQGVIGDTATQGVPIVRQWFKIPKGKQRFGLGDRLVFSVEAVGDAMRNCGINIYKEYS